jgi:phosphoribosylanthranilate isomerase
MKPSLSTAVKVCGVTRAEDALALEALGVDLIGFNFWPGSKRYIEPSAASEIIQGLERAVPVGIFVDQGADEINVIALRTGIQWAQLHGSEGWEVLDGLTMPVIKAIPHDRLSDWGGLREGWNDHPDSQPRYFLVDTQAGSAFGGTGAAFDWDLLKQHPLPRPYFLAGGVGPANIAAAKKAEPFGVDLNSKVEIAPGVKDLELVRGCLAVLGSDDSAL